MVSFAKFKEFFNDIGSSINEMTTFSSDSRGANGQLTREGRRRSSWHDLGSFFRQKESSQLEGADAKNPNTDNKESNGQTQGAQPQATVIQNKNATGRVPHAGVHNASSRTFSTGATAGSTASQLAPGARQPSGGYRNQDLNRNGMVRFSNSRDPNHRGSGSRGYSGGKPVTRSYSAGAADYQRGNLQHRTDHRGIASPNYRIPPTAGRQPFNNAVSSNPSPHTVIHSLSSTNSASNQSIHSLPNFSVASPSNSVHGNLGLSSSRSAPINMDANSNEHRSQNLPPHIKPGMQVYHSGPPFYGPPNSVDPPSMSQGARTGPVPKAAGAYPPSQLQSGYGPSPQNIRGAGMARPLGNNSNEGKYANQRGDDRSRMINHMNQMPLNGPRINPNQQVHQGPSNRHGNSKEPFEEDEDILNGRQTQQYYDQMIAQINDKIAKAVERGQSPYAVYAANDDEESDWC